MSSNNCNQHQIAPKIENALDWFQRSKQMQHRCRRRRQTQINDKNTGVVKLPWWAVFCSDSTNTTTGVASSSPNAQTTENKVVESYVRPIDAAHRFLWGGNSGIAPVDAAWRHAVSSMVYWMFQASQNDDEMTLSSRTRHHHEHQVEHFLSTIQEVVQLPPPPILLLEGPPDVGKTWMMLSLAARYVVATRRRRSFAVTVIVNESSMEVNDMPIVDDAVSMELLPQVIYLDSNFDFSVSKLAYIVRTMLERDIAQKEETHQHHHQQQQQSMFPVELELEECLSRIQVVQVDYGSTDWVPVLEVLRHQFAKQRQEQHHHLEQHPPASTTTTSPKSSVVPTLLLWDGILADISSSCSSSEVLLQLS